MTYMVYGARSGRCIGQTSDPETAAQFQSSGYIVEQG